MSFALRPAAVVAVALVFGAPWRAAAEPVAPGTARADVVAKYGKPAGAVVLGAKEILTFPEGKVVLVNGVAKSFEPAKPKEEDDAPAEPRTSTGVSGGTVSVVPGANGKWLTEPGVAKEQALAQNKRVLFLLTGDMSRCPSGVRFNKEIAGDSSFTRMMSSEYVLLQLDLSAMGNTPDTPIEMGSPEESRMQEKLSLMNGVFPEITLPAMALLSADLKSFAVVDLTEPTSVAGYNNMLGATIRAIKAAKEAPLRNIKVAENKGKKINYAFLAIIGLAVGWMVKRFC